MKNGYAMFLFDDSCLYYKNITEPVVTISVHLPKIPDILLLCCVIFLDCVWCNKTYWLEPYSLFIVFLKSTIKSTLLLKYSNAMDIVYISKSFNKQNKETSLF